MPRSNIVQKHVCRKHTNLYDEISSKHVGKREMRVRLARLIKNAKHDQQPQTTHANALSNVHVSHRRRVTSQSQHRKQNKIEELSPSHHRTCFRWFLFLSFDEWGIHNERLLIPISKFALRDLARQIRAMSTGSRAFRAASSQKVKTQVVRLLFGHKYARKGPEAHRQLDASIYSYADLKKAYLGRIQEIHPDKIRKDSERSADLKRSFQELQEAWAKYEDLAKSMRSVGNGEEDANFTLFGVGCSFSDTEEERALRHEITDQACRGWFSAGLLSESTATNGTNSSQSMRIRPVSLVDDELFTDISKASVENSSQKVESTKSKRKHLIPGFR